MVCDVCRMDDGSCMSATSVSDKAVVQRLSQPFICTISVVHAEQRGAMGAGRGACGEENAGAMVTEGEMQHCEHGIVKETAHFRHEPAEFAFFCGLFLRFLALRMQG